MSIYLGSPQYRFYQSNIVSMTQAPFANKARWNPGGGTYLPIAGDWDGDGTDEPGSYESTTGIWSLKANSTDGDLAAAVPDFPFRLSVPPKGTPLTCDHDGDGSDGVAIYDDTAGRFYFNDTPGMRQPDSNQKFRVTLTLSDVIGLCGDWDGDGVDTPGLYRKTTGRFSLANGSGHAPTVNHDFKFVAGLDRTLFTPLAGDWDGDRVDTVGLYLPANGRFYLTNSHTNTIDYITRFNVRSPPEGLPVVGDWDGQ